MDEDHIRDTDCTDPVDGREHNIAKVGHVSPIYSHVCSRVPCWQVDLSHMFCAKADPSVSAAPAPALASCVLAVVALLGCL